MRANDTIRVAAVQAAPVFLDPGRSAEKAARLIKQAAGRGARLAAFGEAWLSGYPLHTLQSTATAGWWEAAAGFLDHAIDVPGAETDLICAAAQECGVDVVIGVNERDPITQGSVYSTLLFIGAEEGLLGRHRKLKAAPHERQAWGDGDAVDLRVHERDYARLSGLSATEHQMVLPTFALAEQGTQIHVAAWPGATDGPSGPRWPDAQLLSRAFALQTGAYVIAVGVALAPQDAPEPYRDLVGAGFAGGSVIVDPFGVIVAGPVAGENLIVADCSIATARAAKAAFDCAGHSARRDQLKLWSPAIEAHDAAMQDGPPPSEQSPTHRDR